MGNDVWSKAIHVGCQQLLRTRLHSPRQCSMMVTFCPTEQTSTITIGRRGYPEKKPRGVMEPVQLSCTLAVRNAAWPDACGGAPVHEPRTRLHSPQPSCMWTTSRKFVDHYLLARVSLDRETDRTVFIVCERFMNTQYIEAGAGS